MEQRLANRSFAVVCEGLTQAMMIVDLTTRARVETQKGQHLVYVDFLEAAPWHRRELTVASPRFAGAGSPLIGAAIEPSKAEGLQGRIGPHTLPPEHAYYANKRRKQAARKSGVP